VRGGLDLAAMSNFFICMKASMTALARAGLSAASSLGICSGTTCQESPSGPCTSRRRSPRRRSGQRVPVAVDLRLVLAHDLDRDRLGNLNAVPPFRPTNFWPLISNSTVMVWPGLLAAGRLGRIGRDPPSFEFGNSET
jgi:hypothetical protein